MERRFGVLLAILLTGALLLALPAPTGAQGGTGVGVAPATVQMDDPPLLRGGGKVATLQFQQHDHELARVELSVQQHNTDGSSGQDAGDASTWISLSTPEGPCGTRCEIDVPRTADYPVEVEVAVPETAANGLYAARVHFRLTQACEADGGACVGIQAAASSTIWIDVQDVGEIKRILVPGSIQIHDMEAGGQFQFTVPLENTGNVDANPHLHLQVLDKQQNDVVAEHWQRDQNLRPGERGDYTFIIDDLDLVPDQYWARVDVYLDGELVHEGSLRTFDVVPPGTLNQNAELRTIRIDGDITTARVGDLVRLEAVVENTGSIPVVATFQGSVLVDGQLVDTLESAAREIAIGATEGIEMFYRIEHQGQHVFEGRIHYGNKITEERTLLLAAVDTGINVPGWTWFLLGGLVPVALVGVYLLGRRGGSGGRRGKRPPSRPGGPASRRTSPAAGGRRPQASRRPGQQGAPAKRQGPGPSPSRPGGRPAPRPKGAPPRRGP